MKKALKHLTALALAGILVVSLAACDLADIFKRKDDFDPAGYVQGLLDVMYHGDFDAGFLEKHDMTENEAEEVYLNNLEAESNVFLYHFSFDYDLTEYPTEDLKDQAIELYKKIYAKTDYTIVSTTEQEDGSYAIKLTVRPLDLVNQMDKGYEAWFTEFMTQYKDMDTEGMDEAGYQTWYTEELWPAYVQAVLDWANELLPGMGTLAEKSIVVQMEQVDEDKDTIYYDLNEDDYYNLDALLVDYTGA